MDYYVITVEEIRRDIFLNNITLKIYMCKRKDHKIDTPNGYYENYTFPCIFIKEIKDLYKVKIYQHKQQN